MQVLNTIGPNLPQPGAAATSTPSGTSGAPASSTDQLTNETTFLQLLVSQIKNQDPMNPSDPTQFIGQLVQFSQLEQLLGINQGIQSLVKSQAPTNGAPPARVSRSTN